MRGISEYCSIQQLLNRGKFCNGLNCNVFLTQYFLMSPFPSWPDLFFLLSSMMISCGGRPLFSAIFHMTWLTRMLFFTIRPKRNRCRMNFMSTHLSCNSGAGVILLILAVTWVNGGCRVINNYWPRHLKGGRRAFGMALFFPFLEHLLWL